MKMNKKIKIGGILFGVVCLSGAAVQSASDLFFGQGKAEQTSASEYQTATVQKGNVSVGITESGTVEFGTKEQTFSVAEITEVSLTDSEESSDTQSTDDASGFSSGGTSMAAGGGQSAMGMETTGGESAASSSAASGTGTELVVEEVYAAVGQSVQKGEKLFKITSDSIEDYREALEQAVETAKLQVSEEEIQVQSKKAEADYTYAMYLAQGETAEATYQATLAELDAAVADLEEELEEAQEDGDEDEIEELEAQLQIAENNRSTQSIEAKQTYDNTMTNYKYADQLYAIDTEGLEDDFNDARETLEEAEENLTSFEEEIGDGIVYAQYSGTVTELAYAAGDTLTNDATAVTFTDSDNVTMTVLVSQDDIAQISVGGNADIALTAYEEEIFSGEVASVSASAVSGSSTVNYEVSVRFTGDTSAVYSGMTGDVTFAVRSETDTLYIPNRAVYQNGTDSMVKVLAEDGSIRETEIETGFSNGTVVAVESGLEQGQTVIIESKVSE